MSDYFVKVYGSILDSSVWSESAETRIVWVTMLAMADQFGFVESSLPGLARRANVSLDACDLALSVLLAPDPYSKSPEHDGRRVEKVPRGWKVLNYEAYRELRTRSQDDAARRKREQRAREREGSGQGGVTVTDVTDEDVTVTPVTDASTSTSTSPSAVAVEEQDQKQKPVGREGPKDALAVFLVEWDFGQFEPIVEGYIRSQRSPVAVMATFRMHLTGEMAHEKATVAQLGLAVQQYSANEGSAKFSARYFAGFVRDVKKGIERGENRQRNTVEQKHIDRETQARDSDQREADMAAKLIAEFQAANPTRFAELERIADEAVPKKFTFGRDLMVHGKLLTLVRAEVSDAK